MRADEEDLDLVPSAKSAPICGRFGFLRLRRVVVVPYDDHDGTTREVRKIIHRLNGFAQMNDKFKRVSSVKSA
jgi:hypothetical protein